MNWHRAILLMLFVALLSGCVQTRYFELGLPLTEEDSPDPKADVSMADVMERLGPPLRLSATPNGYIMAWEYWHVSQISVGFSPAGADFLSLDWGSATAKGDFLLMSFDKKRRLLTSHLKEWKFNAGGGQGIQAFASAVDVVDIDDLLERLPIHEWGFNSLDELPTALNRDSRMDSGQRGLEQRGTSRRVGQHSLEMD
ncbi:MAG: hypothetical protein ACI8PP_002808 [Candidatus Pseudothioglobus sp.]